MDVLPVIGAWALNSACRIFHTSSQPYIRQFCDHENPDIAALKRRLSFDAVVYAAGTEAFVASTERWSNIAKPNPQWIVVAATEQDVAETVKYAVEIDVPFLAMSGRHGAMASLESMQGGIGIRLDKLNSVGISADNSTARIGGGGFTKDVTDALWRVNKQTVTGTCECTGYIGPGLGGGHGWLQGRYGLIADQWLSANIVLADGTLAVAEPDSDLWWALNGAGHNFGIITSVVSKIYDVRHQQWAHTKLIFAGEDADKVYEAVNTHHLRGGSQPVDLISWSYMVNIPPLSEKPVIMMFILQEGVSSIDTRYIDPFLELQPLNVVHESGTYGDLARWAQIDMDGAPCRKSGAANIRHPIYLEAYNPAAVRKMYNRFAEVAHQDGPFEKSLVLLEGYSTQGVKAVPGESTAYAFRDDNLLISPLIIYVPDGDKLDAEAAAAGQELRDIIYQGSGSDEMHAYVNYAYETEPPKNLYGTEDWRQQRLLDLKNKYDPQRRFNFFGPIA
ncbi:hypothetical protein VHEMI07507 [[Torrubiella] hemipterigena]|uniref:FAD-binding PCMH-type domain-containing protein n=1 Tax=[Torrubiella] hemipterigena TaxID=1531966 RepID=A0A0A1TLT6_9HYPO|nr:hypothetical protein VHEMI07507 [[Torrubiella] hemipterigena]